MKKTLFSFSLLMMSVLGFTGCVSSEHIGIENKFLNDDLLVEGIWVYQLAPDEKDDLDMMPAKIILSKAGKKGEYALEMVKKPKEGAEAQPNAKISAFVGKINNVAVFSFGGMNKKKQMQFYNGVYTLKGDQLTLRIMVEKGAIKDGNDVKATTFASMKEVQDFVTKNIASEEYLSKEVKFKKQ